jgi:hypothetical protein
MMHLHDKMRATVLADEADEYEPPPVPDRRLGPVFMHRIGQYKSVDTLIASAELRRAHTLREIDAVASLSPAACADEIIDGEFAALPQAAE